MHTGPIPTVEAKGDVRSELTLRPHCRRGQPRATLNTVAAHCLTFGAFDGILWWIDQP